MTKSTANQPVVAYYRVSTARQGESGLGIEAQQAEVAKHLASTGAPLLTEFTEFETGTRKRYRPQLAKAIVECRARGAVLVIAKLDRLARNVAFLSALMESDVPFRALDVPDATPLTLHIYAAMAENTAKDISSHTKAALQAAKARGTKLGNPKNLTDYSRRCALDVRQAQVADAYRLVFPYLTAWVELGWSLQRMANELTGLRIPQPRKPKAGQAPRPWQSVQVQRLIALAQREAAAKSIQ